MGGLRIVLWLTLTAMAFCFGAIVQSVDDIVQDAIIGFFGCCWVAIAVVTIGVFATNKETVVAPCWYCGCELEEGDELCPNCEETQP